MAGMKEKDRSNILIGVVGAGRVIDDSIISLAYNVGKIIARRGAILICGGLAGVMEAAAKGAVEAKGITVGLLPGNDKKSANPYIQIPIATNLGHARNAIIAQASDGLISVGGSYGTLSEISLALKMGKPVVALRPPVEIPGVEVCESPEDAVECLFRKLEP